MADLSKAERAKLEGIVAATRTEAGCVAAKPASVKKLVEAGLVEVGAALDNGAENYVRATATGLDMFPLTENESANPGAIENQTIESDNSMSEVQTVDGSIQAAKPKRVHNMVDASTISLGMGLPPTGKRGGGSGRKGVYPFANLPAPQRDASGAILGCAYFFVPATAERPEPARSLNATVSGANKKAAETVDPATGLVAQYKVYADSENGVDGAKVFRVQ